MIPSLQYFHSVPIENTPPAELSSWQFCIWIVFRRTHLPYGYIQWRVVITTISFIILFSFIIPNFITKLFFHNDSVVVSMTYFSNENRFKIMFLYGLTLFFTVVKSYVIPCLYQCDKTDINYMVDDIYIMQASEWKKALGIQLWDKMKEYTWSLMPLHNKYISFRNKSSFSENYTCAVFVFFRLPKNQQ